ncbi:MAG: MupA/Atu3671 family FMN-dependent luciferase-like monooxygenase, partial [bacterium]
ALLHGETEYGISFHEMAGGIDEGDLQIQRRFPIGPQETSLTLNTRCFENAIEAFGELVDGLAAGGIRPTPQDLSERTYFGRHERPAGAGVCDWERPASEVERCVRALDFGHYENAFAAAKIVHQGRVCLPGSAEVSDPAEGGEPGRLLEIDAEGWRVACGESTSIRLRDLRSPTGEPLSPDEAARRLGIRAGERLIGLGAAERARLDELVRATTPAEGFWVRRLAQLDSPEIPLLRSDRGPETEGGIRSVEIEIPERFRSVCPEAPATALIAAFAGYLARVNGRSEFDLTLSDARFGEQLEGLGELYSREVPLRIDLDLAGDVGAAIDSVERALDETRKRGGFLNDVVRRYPLLQQDEGLASGRLASVGVALTSDLDGHVPRVGTDCSLVVDPSGQRARLVHDLRALSPEAASQLAHHLRVFLAGASDPARPLARVPMLDDEGRRRVLEDWNRTDVDFDRSQTIHALFEAQAARTPERTAVVFEGDRASYAELDRRANQLAHHLVGLGIGPDALVGLYVERSVDMLVSMLGVLKAGGAYVPLDPAYPADRIEYMIQDSGATVVVTQGKLLDRIPASDAVLVAVDRDADEIGQRSPQPPSIPMDPSHLAYVIYTSGSTGKPKGVMVEHRNVVNFFVGMDDRIPHDPPGVWLAVTSLSFDISVLELLWTLTRGFEVVVFTDRQRTAEAGEGAPPPWRPVDFGLALWGSDAGPGPRKYELMLESARFGDERGFRSVHTPERHFGAFGGPFPNPSVTSAAIAAVTSRIEIRASSCVLPLHHPVRVAEEWAVVDNLSGGRVGISFASGWQPNDFVIRPDAFADAKKKLFEGAEAVKRLWRGEGVEFVNPKGEKVETRTLPRPVQSELPAWLTTAGNVETFRAAGEGGFNVLTHLLGQTLEELAEKIKVYRRGRASAGLDPKTGVVTCMLHTYVGEDNDAVRELVRQPMKDYLASAMQLVMGFAWSFPAFERPGGPNSKPEDVDLASLTEEETDAILEFAFERYYETSGLFGTPEICARMVERVKAADIDEIASLIDFGLPTDVVLDGLEHLDRVRREANERPETAVAADLEEAVDDSLPAQVEAYGVTHLQCTPSHATM